MNPPKRNSNCIAKYVIRKEDSVGHMIEDKRNYDLMTVLMLCIGSPEDDNYDGIIKLLEVLLSNRMNAVEKKKILNREFGIEMTRKMEEEVLGMCNLSDLIERQGMEKGIEQGTVLILKNLMETMQWTIEEALLAMKIPEDEWEKYRSMQ